MKSKTTEITGNGIIINNLFNGEYLNFDENIGHEIINLYQCDNGSYYVYINPKGYISKGEDKKYKYVLFTRTVKGDKKVKVLAKAELCEQILINITNSKTSSDDSKVNKINGQQKNYIKENNIKYGEVFLDEIFDKNNHSFSSSYYITFKAKEIRKSKVDIYLPNQNDKIIDNSAVNKIKKYNPTSQKIYIDENHSQYDEIKKILFNEDNWGDLCTKVETNNNNVLQEETFLKIIKKEYDEIIISNLIAYYFEKDIVLWEKFCDKYNIPKCKSIPIIKREYKNIDIFITYGNQLVIIENKIKSKINGKKKDSETQYNDNILSQLDKYYEIGTKYNDDDNLNYQSNYFLLRPNYNSENIGKFKYSDKYKKIQYSDLLEILEDHNSDLPYFTDFRKIIKKHSSEFSDELLESVEAKFHKMIKSKQQK